MPDNAFYYRAAYTVAATVYSAYALSVWWRLRTVHRRLQAVRPETPHQLRATPER